ncbi:hypothetical protein Y032_0285g1356 [Ancylostoma ceylanicum]|nr:hypothetical protein Y032_0285g1356 [Ancylostoma ceylanicum]
MTREQRKKDKDLRKQDRELNEKEHNGNKISLVIFRIQFYVKIMQEKKVTSDGIPAFFFEKFADKLCQPLAHIFNISLIVRTVPSL